MDDEDSNYRKIQRMLLRKYGNVRIIQKVKSTLQ